MNKLESVLQEIKKSRNREKFRTKLILEYYGVSRKGWRVCETINFWLDKYELIMEPRIEVSSSYGFVEIFPKPTMLINGELKNPKYTDSIPRLSIIKSSDLNNLNSEDTRLYLLSVKKETTIREAITLMIKHKYSQIPILSSKNVVFGLVSWKSIGKALALGKKCETVCDCYETVEVLSYDEPLFKAVKIVLDKEVILVRDYKNEISGIVTATDIGEQFLILSEPFLLIEQIENLIRRLLNGKLTLDDINDVLDIERYEKEIKHLSDLSFGHYVRIIENQVLFDKIGIQVDRVILKKMLAETNVIRNEVMHFNPEALKKEDLHVLRETLDFLQSIV